MNHYILMMVNAQEIVIQDTPHPLPNIILMTTPVAVLAAKLIHRIVLWEAKAFSLHYNTCHQQKNPPIKFGGFFIKHKVLQPTLNFGKIAGIAVFKFKIGFQFIIKPCALPLGILTGV